MGHLFRNLRVSLRQFRAFPGFAATVVLTLALGIGATTAIFSVIKAVVLNPLPFRDPQRLVHVWEGFRGGHYHRGDDAYFISVRPGTFYDWRAQSESFTEMSAYHWRDLIFTRGGQSELLTAHEVVEHFFETLGTPASLGRTLDASDYAPNAQHVAVLSNRLWVNRFGRAPRMIGREISLDHQAYSVVGVMPEGFYLTGRDYPDLWIAHWADQKEPERKG